MTKKLKQFLKGQLLVAMFPTMRNTEGGSSAGIEEIPTEGEPVNVEPNSGIESATESVQPPEDDISSYLGSEHVNPDKKPLKSFDRTGMSKEEIDDFIMVNGADVFLSPEEIAKKIDAEKEIKSEEKLEKEPEQAKADKKPEDVEFDEDVFLKSNGLSREEFAQIPESIQEKLANSYVNPEATTIEQNEQYVSLKTNYDKLSTDVEALLDDPYVAARVEELKTGKQYIPESLPPITKSELQEIQSAQTVEEFENAINKYIQERAEPAVKKLISVYEQKEYDRKMFAEASSVMSEVMKLDPRLKANVTEKDWSKLNANHPQWKEFNKGPIKIAQYVLDKGFKHHQIAKMTPQEIYAAIAAKEGWQKEKEGKIAKNSVKAFLASYKKNATQAKSVSEGRRSSAPMSKENSMGDSRESLVKQLASGDRSSFERMLAAADGNPDELDRLESIQYEAIRVGREMRSKR